MTDTVTAPDTRTQDSSRSDSPSRFFWYELMTPDQDAAVDFYSHVVGWTAADQQMTDSAGGRYLILSAGDRGIGGVMELTGEMEDHGARPSWLGYIHVADVDAAVRSITEAGGRLFMGPHEVPDVGRFAMVADPGGAPFYVMTPKPPEGQAPAPIAADAIGNVGWRELYAGDGERAAFAFYSSQFGWESLREMDMGAMGTYRIFGLAGEQMGGIMTKPENVPAASWGFYFNVDGIDAAIERVKAKGGQVLMGPHEVPGGSWVIQGVDPQGASFALVSAKR